MKIQILNISNGDEIMKIRSMTIDNICGIKHLELSFNIGLNLICGANGVGKTTILKSIAHQFLHGRDSFIKKHSGSEKGIVSIILEGVEEPIKYEIADFVPGYLDRYIIDKQKSDELIYFPSSRTIEYRKIDALPAIGFSNTNDNFHSAQLLAVGVDKDIKSWFVNRLIFSKLDDSLTEYQKSNLEISKGVFKLLDNQLSVKTARPDYEIVLNKGQDEIYLEMLSDGYKSCVFILLGIIKEVEYRYSSIKAVDYSGVVMIDEIDVHLHPQWQAKLVKVLKEVFPNAQIIATTHSPSVLQNAEEDEIIPLYKDEDNNTHIKELHLGEYGLQGWTLEEILKDVMGMPSTTSELFKQIMEEFDKAMYEENIDVVKEKYEILKKMLHPNSTLRRLLQIQMAGMEE